jgi:(2Fe-2S) ferredoxin
MSSAELVQVEPANGSATPKQLRRVVICAGTGCMANGAMKVFEQFKRAMAETGLQVILELREEAATDEVRLSKSGCQGFCQMGPLVSVIPDGILYTKVRSEDVAEIVVKTLTEGQVVERLLYKDSSTWKTIRFTHGRTGWCCTSADLSIRKTFANTCCTADTQRHGRRLWRWRLRRSAS